MSARGGKRYGSGRKLLSPSSYLKSSEKRSETRRSWNKNHGRMWIRHDVMATFKALKAKCVYSSDTAFVQHLLAYELRRQRSLDARKASKEKRRQAKDVQDKDGIDVLTSTPVKRDSRGDEALAVSPIDVVNVASVSFEDDVDITGTDTSQDISSSSSSISDDSSEEDEDYNDNYLNISGMSNALKQLVANADGNSDYSDNDSDEDYWGEESGSEHDLDMTVEENAAVEFELSGVLEVDESEPEVLLHPIPTMASVSTQTEERETPTIPFRVVPPVACVNGPPRESKFSRWEDNQAYQQELQLVQGTKVICALDLLMQVFATKCQNPGCQQQTWVDYTLCGPSALVKWTCPLGHKGKFWTSHKVNGALVNNLQTSAAILLSGCSFIKVAKMAQFLGLSFPSKSTFYRAQRLYLIPAVTEWWKWQQEKIFSELKGKQIVVAGDGQCDSPGFTAKNLCYFLMETTTTYIIDLEVLDKREVDMKSVNMEKQALNNILLRLQILLTIIEVVTDASASIKKLIADGFRQIFHSLDVWHKSKGIRKCLTSVGSAKGMEKVALWTDNIVRHFWHCSSLASEVEGTDAEALKKMKDTWISLLHHVCDQHEWADGKCDHEPITNDNHKLPWFDRRSKDFEALQEVILNSDLLESFKYYTKFRHTGALERANSMSLMYASKRYAYTKKVYKARKQLAALDWNYHADVPDQEDVFGEVAVTRKYNQRTKTWNVKIVKQAKDYGYIWMLLARIFRLRMEDNDNMQRIVPMENDDPRRIAPTIAVVPAPTSRELFVQHSSRFSKDKKE